MENPTVSELRSRSRSKTPFLRSSCDREHCTEGEDHIHKSGRKTPVSRNTPVKQLYTNTMTEITEDTQNQISSPAHRTRQSTRAAAEKIKTSDYSSEESLDRLKTHGKEVYQNEINSQYERVSTSSHGYSTFADVTLSPIQSMHNVTHDRSSRIGSPTYSACSTDSSFAEQALADTSALLDREPTYDHLPYRLYKMAGEYWNKYPKTDYTYSHMSKDRVELAPGQVAVPNMSRRSLSMFRLQGPNTSADETDRLTATTTWSTTATRKRYTVADTSDDEGMYYQGNGGHHHVEQPWWITRVLVGFISAITTAVSNSYRRVVGPKHRYPYTDRRPEKGNILTTPFIWMYTLITKVITTTVTTITETFTQSNESERDKYISRSHPQQTKKRSWWPWILLFLLPLIGYGCYNYKDYILPREIHVIDNYKAPVIIADPDLTKRMAALEQWAVDVDSKFKYFDQKLSKLNNLEAQIEQYSIKYLQNNLVQIFSTANVGPIAAKLKEYFDEHYLTKDQKQVLSQEIHERLIASWDPSIDEDRIRRIVQEYLSVFERQQMEVLVSKIQEYVKEVEVRHVDSGFDVEAVKKIIAGMLDIYDADKIGLVDYALESAGGQVISTKCTELYQIKTKQYSILGLPVWWVYTSPRYALTPGAMPAECWAFQSFPGYLVIRTYAIIEVTGFSLEHMSRLLAVEGKIESAPKNFSVYGLHGELDPEPHLFGDYVYDANGTSIQYFPVKHQKTVQIGGSEYPVAYDMIELRVESNHGNPTYTCVYRFRVHGNPLTDIRQATEDSIRENET